MTTQAQVLLHQNQQGFPSAETPFVDDERRIDVVWLKFLAFLFANLTSLVTEGISAAGGRQDTATQLISDWNVVSLTPVGTGVMLPSPIAGNPPTVVWNLGANPLNVYPTDGMGIDALGVNAPYILAVGKSQIFYPTKNNLMRTLQLG